MSNTNFFNKPEKEYIQLFGKLYKKRGFTNTLGQIFAILSYKANTPEEGLDQQEIARMIDRSVSTASRLLNKLVDMQYCNFIEQINENDRRERKYYMSKSINQIASRRFKFLIKESKELKNELISIQDEIPKNQQDNHEEISKHLEYLISQVEKLIEFYSRVLKLSKELFD
ncbi:MAG: hypothetical protein GF317_19670 [Candidatus Lokiarchaeota archaeon]|nr:hypothetical protein [Candidatus Lokiarchaeota archaeon]MBD3201716.1 hypothetical protein [Candidatus Lokiarchaeota archaeon]